MKKQQAEALKVYTFLNWTVPSTSSEQENNESDAKYLVEINKSDAECVVDSNEGTLEEKTPTTASESVSGDRGSFLIGAYEHVNPLNKYK